MPEEPNEVLAAAMAAEVLSGPLRVTRFPTGTSHFVYEAVSSDDRAVVVRASRGSQVEILRDALYWSQLLRPMGVPLPEVLHADDGMSRHPFPFMILERLPGRDLGQVVGDLSEDELSRLAGELARVQEIVTSLPPGKGFGFTPHRDGPFPHESWAGVLTGQVARSRRRLRAAGIVCERLADRVETALLDIGDYCADVPATPFLHDITTKNVIVEGGRLSGIVDVDDLCFGDPLFLVGLIRMALLAHGHAPFYAECWRQAYSRDRDADRVLDVYTALFALTFLSEFGHRFNRAEAAAVDSVDVARLEGLLARHLT